MSCSQPLAIGNQFGGLVVAGFLGENGETGGVSPPPPPVDKGDVVLVPGSLKFKKGGKHLLLKLKNESGDAVELKFEFQDAILLSLTDYELKIDFGAGLESYCYVGRIPTGFAVAVGDYSSVRRILVYTGQLISPLKASHMDDNGT